MKKIIIPFLLLFSFSAFGKPVITYKYTGSIFKFWWGGYSYVNSVATYEVIDNVAECKTVDVSCSGDGAMDCAAVYKTAVNPNPFTEPEQDLILNLQTYAKCQIESGVKKGIYSSPINIQSGNNNPEAYVYTITWDVNDDGGTITIKNEKLN